MKNLIMADEVDGKEIKIKFKIKNIPIQIENKKFIIRKLLYFSFMNGDFLLGINFLKHFIQYKLIILV